MDFYAKASLASSAAQAQSPLTSGSSHLGLDSAADHGLVNHAAPLPQLEAAGAETFSRRDDELAGSGLT